MINEFFKKLNPYQGMIYFWALIGMIVISFVFMVVGDAQEALDTSRKAVISDILKDYRKVIDHGTHLMVEYNGKQYRYEKARTQEDNELAYVLAREIHTDIELRQTVLRACRSIVGSLSRKSK